MCAVACEPRHERWSYEVSSNRVRARSTHESGAVCRVHESLLLVKSIGVVFELVAVCLRSVELCSA